MFVVILLSPLIIILVVLLLLLVVILCSHLRIVASIKVLLFPIPKLYRAYDPDKKNSWWITKSSHDRTVTSQVRKNSGTMTGEKTCVFLLWVPITMSVDTNRITYIMPARTVNYLAFIIRTALFVQVTIAWSYCYFIAAFVWAAIGYMTFSFNLYTYISLFGGILIRYEQLNDSHYITHSMRRYTDLTFPSILSASVLTFSWLIQNAYTERCRPDQLCSSIKVKFA